MSTHCQEKLLLPVRYIEGNMERTGSEEHGKESPKEIWEHSFCAVKDRYVQNQLRSAQTENYKVYIWGRIVSMENL